MEEEFILIDPGTGVPLPVAAVALASVPAGARVTGELQLEQLETATDPCQSLAVLADQIIEGRRAADAGARIADARIASLATSPLPVVAHLGPERRYREISKLHGIIADEQLTCGMHVHVEVASEEEGIGVLDRIRTWLPTLLALSGNSPFWAGQDTGHASYRSRVWNRWPSTGPTPIFGSVPAYHHLVEDLVASGVLLDEGMVYFDARLSARFPTVEIRVPDACLDPRDTELIAGLSRGLVETAARQWRTGMAAEPVPTAIVQAAMWRAARSGLDGELLDPRTGRPVPARQVMGSLLAHVHPALESTGDAGRLEFLLSGLQARGNGAQRQRQAYALRDDITDVVTDAVFATQGPMQDETRHDRALQAP